MKVFLKTSICIIIILVYCSSCRTWFDLDKKNGNYKASYDNIEFNCYDDYNEIISKPKIGVNLGHNIFYCFNPYKMRIPKKVKSYCLIDKAFYLEYPQKQMVIINGGYKETRKNLDFNLVEIRNDKFYLSPSEYTPKKELTKSKGCLTKPQEGRVTKLYTDGNVEIVFYNVKPETLEKWTPYIDTFKQID